MYSDNANVESVVDQKYQCLYWQEGKFENEDKQTNKESKEVNEDKYGRYLN